MFKIIFISFIILATSIGTAVAHPIDKAELAKMFEEYLLANPEVVELALIKNQRNKEDRKSQKINDFIQANKTLIENPEGLFIGGNPDGDITLVEFFDYNCTYCKQSFDGINLLLETDKNLKLVMYELPILAQSSLTAARASLAAKVQGKYWQFHSVVIGHQGTLTEEMIFAYAVQIGLDIDQLKIDMVSETTEKALIASSQLAESLEVNGTPAFIIDGQLFPGAIGYENILAVIADSRAQRSVQTSTN
ncbi:MAG: hypothetical protein COB24_06765 [Hyphomicrobiales bacterium]|nr:MAG: hypothetical protein COB24_06765 [Hyphomicrobiales bacterium]